MKQLGKMIVFFFMTFSIIILVSCKNDLSIKESTAPHILVKSKQIDECLQEKDSTRIIFFINELITDLKTDKKLINNYIYKEYNNPDITALENLIKYEIISKEINFEKNDNNDGCNSVYINFNTLTEEFVDDEGTKHNVEYSIILEIQKLKTKIKIVKILASG